MPIKSQHESESHDEESEDLFPEKVVSQDLKANEASGKIEVL